MALDRDVQERDARRESLAVAEARFLRERAGVDRRERLAAWREWVAKKLIADFILPADPAKRDRLIGQCTAELEVLVRQLFDRGWLIEGKRLAQVVGDCLAPIAAAQQAGKIGDFYPYFRSSVRRYVGANAEEIQQATRRDGAEAGAISIGAVMAGLVGRIAGPSIVEVVGDRASYVQPSEKAIARGRGRPHKVTGSETLPLFDVGE
ncbi:MAG: hypothetical protein RIQ79_2219 [Verrucomicrobiota bacterium]|jgi:hypothetical protein